MNTESDVEPYRKALALHLNSSYYPFNIFVEIWIADREYMSRALNYAPEESTAKLHYSSLLRERM